MKHLYSLILLAFLSSTVIAQDYPVRIEVEKGKSSVQFYAVNDLSETQEVEFTLTEKKGLKGYTKPVVKTVAPGARRLMISVTFSGAYSYSTSYRWVSKPNKTEQIAKAKQLKEKVLNEFGNIKKGIVVFEKNNCSRCNMSTSFLLDNDIDFKMIDVTQDGDGNRLMWEYIRKDKSYKEGESILTPAFLVDGKFTHSHKDLRAFLASLVK